MKTERELFELEVKKYEDCDLSKNEDGSYKSDLTHTCFYWWCKSAQRKGYKLVPVEPKQETIKQMNKVWFESNCAHIMKTKTAELLYKAMIGACDEH